MLTRILLHETRSSYLKQIPTPISQSSLFLYFRNITAYEASRDRAFGTSRLCRILGASLANAASDFFLGAIPETGSIVWISTRGTTARLEPFLHRGFRLTAVLQGFPANGTRIPSNWALSVLGVVEEIDVAA